MNGMRHLAYRPGADVGPIIGGNCCQSSSNSICILFCHVMEDSLWYNTDGK